MGWTIMVDIPWMGDPDCIFVSLDVFSYFSSAHQNHSWNWQSISH